MDRLELVKNDQAKLEAELKKIQHAAEAGDRTHFSPDEEQRVEEIFRRYMNTVKMERQIWYGNDEPA